MLSLRELQQRFVEGLLTGELHEVLPLLANADGPARFDVYQRNCREGFHAALAAGYPVLRRLTGPEYFRQLIGDYQRAHPSGSGNLLHAGARLPEFLVARFATTAYAYFADVARLERACQEVFVAADGGVLDPQRLGRVAPADYARLCFRLDPAVRLVKSPYPVVSLWETHQNEQEPPALDLDAGGEQAAIQRRDDRVVLFRLSPAEHAALALMQDRQPLDAALAAALALDADFDLRAVLPKWVQWRFVVDFHLADESHF